MSDYIDLTGTSDSEDAPNDQDKTLAVEPHKTNKRKKSEKDNADNDSLSLDTSVLILYENVQPSSEVQIVKEVSRCETVIQNSPVNNAPVMMGNVTIPSNDTATYQPSALIENAMSSERISQSGRKIECGICFEQLDEILASSNLMMSTNCGHIFCQPCIDSSLLQNKQCPKCRKRLSKKQVHALYF